MYKLYALVIYQNGDFISQYFYYDMFMAGLEIGFDRTLIKHI
jgi:hypothetical protein